MCVCAVYPRTTDLELQNVEVVPKPFRSAVALLRQATSHLSRPLEVQLDSCSKIVAAPYLFGDFQSHGGTALPWGTPSHPRDG